MSLLPPLNVGQHLVTLKIICEEERHAPTVSHAHQEHKALQKPPFVFSELKKHLSKLSPLIIKGPIIWLKINTGNKT